LIYLYSLPFEREGWLLLGIEGVLPKSFFSVARGSGQENLSDNAGADDDGEEWIGG
jgi:hypothetical protein